MLDIFVRRWPIKLLALGLAFVIWLAIKSEGRVVRDYGVPLVVALGSDAILEANPPTSVTVRLRGPENLLQGTTGLDMEVRVDLRDADVGRRNVQLSAGDVEGIPPGVEVESIEPARVQFEVARRERRVVPVVPSVTGRPPKGFAFYDAAATPDTFEIEGPASEIGTVGRLRTDPVHLEDRTSPFVVRVGAVPDSPDILVIDPKPVEVSVIVDVAPREARFEGVPVVLAGAGADESSVPGKADVTIAAPPAVLARVLPANLRVIADLSASARGKARRGVPLRVDFVGVSLEDLARVNVKAVDPREVDIRTGSAADGP